MLLPERDEKFGWRREGDLPAPAPDAVRQWLSEWLDGRPIRDVRLMPGGLMNRNCRVSMDGSPDVVLRLYDRDSAAAATERAVLEMVGSQLPVPGVLFARTDAEPGRPPFLVLTLVDGVPLIDVRRSGNRPAVEEAAFDAGRLLGALTQYPFDNQGYLSPRLSVETARLPSPLTTESLVAHFGRTPAFRSRAGTLLEALLRCAREWDERPRAPVLPPTLVHGDFNSRNILVNPVGGRWRVTAILDWEFAFAGSLYIDIGNFLRYERAGRPRFEPAFSSGLRESGFSLEGDWRAAARMADLPALCELLSRDSTPDDVAAEVLELVRETLRSG